MFDTYHAFLSKIKLDNSTCYLEKLFSNFNLSGQGHENYVPKITDYFYIDNFFILKNQCL